MRRARRDIARPEGGAGHQDRLAERDDEEQAGVRGGPSQFVHQAVQIHTIHTPENSIAVSIVPSGVRCASIRCDSWVMANTNTRSKNSPRR
jgi:hypothetical protein